MRIVSLIHNGTEILFALGAGPSQTGRVRACSPSNGSILRTSKALDLASHRRLALELPGPHQILELR